MYHIYIYIHSNTTYYDFHIEWNIHWHLILHISNVTHVLACPGHLCLTSGLYIFTFLIKKPSYFRLVWNRHLLHNGFAKKGRKKWPFFCLTNPQGFTKRCYIDVSNKSTMIFLSCRNGCILLKRIQKVTCLQLLNCSLWISFLLGTFLGYGGTLYSKPGICLAYPPYPTSLLTTVPSFPSPCKHAPEAMLTMTFEFR